jgi:hypothetical protein
MELTLKNTNDKIQGTIYCTDEISNTIVLKTSLVHTTLSSQITVINADVVMDRRCVIVEGDDGESGEGSGEGAQQQQQQQVSEVLPNVSRRMVEERERRAIKLMEESFSHVNQKVSKIERAIGSVILSSQLYADGGGMCVNLERTTVTPPFSLTTLSLLFKHQYLSNTNANNIQLHIRHLPRDKKYLTNYSRHVIR